MQNFKPNNKFDADYYEPPSWRTYVKFKKIKSLAYRCHIASRMDKQIAQLEYKCDTQLIRSSHY